MLYPTHHHLPSSSHHTEGSDGIVSPNYSCFSLSNPTASLLEMSRSNHVAASLRNVQVNEVVLYGESHVTVRQALSRAASCSQRVRLTVSRKAQTVNVFVPRPEQSLPIAYPLLAAGDDRLVKVNSIFTIV